MSCVAEALPVLRILPALPDKCPKCGRFMRGSWPVWTCSKDGTVMG